MTRAEIIVTLAGLLAILSLAAIPTADLLTPELHFIKER